MHLEQVACTIAGQAVFQGLTFTLGPGLTLIQGAEGRGKTSLLRVLAGRLSPSQGQVLAPIRPVCWRDPQDDANDRLTVRDWIAQCRRRFDAWNEQAEQQAVAELRLQEHLDKARYMLSSGTDRKLALVAAFASQAPLVLLDLPYAALDARSRQALTQRLIRQATDRPSAAWVIADYEPPDGLAIERFRAVIDLGG
jgi:ABC-type transport system involved in cytochrome c biogenesis ATPase subunit